jgi:hypothetical protein
MIPEQEFPEMELLHLTPRAGREGSAHAPDRGRRTPGHATSRCIASCTPERDRRRRRILRAFAPEWLIARCIECSHNLKSPQNSHHLRSTHHAIQ